MQNLFDTINASLPKAPQAPLAQDKPAAMAPPLETLEKVPTKRLVQIWQKDAKPEYTTELLKRMKPAMSSAINSYARGMESQLSVKAAKLTLSALKAYNPEAGADVSTFVFHNLKRLNRLASKSSNIMPVPESVALDVARLQKAMAKFQDDHDRDPSDQELADMTGLSLKKVNNLLDGRAVVSESSTLNPETQSSTLSSNTLTDRDYFEYVYSSMDPINQKIMEWASGAHGKPKLSNNEIAAKLRMSPAAISQRSAKIQKSMADIRSLA